MVKLYPWDDWFKLRRFTVRRGVDYSCSPYSMGQQIRNAAARRRVAINVISHDRDSFTVVIRGRGKP